MVGSDFEPMVGALATLLGVDARTVTRWGTGQLVPRAIAQRAIRDVFVRRGLPPPTWPA